MNTLRRLLLVGALTLSAPPAHADGAFPDARQILLPPNRPDHLTVATNFGLLFSEDAGTTWLYSCEQPLNAFASRYQLGAAPSHRLFALTGAGLVYSDDDSCTWNAAGGVLAEVMPYSFAVDPSDDQRLYAIGVPRDDFHAGESLYVSTDGGVSFGAPLFTAPPRSALLSVVVEPSKPSTLYASLFGSPENHPSLLRSDDAGANWQIVAELVDSLGENPFDLLAIEDSTLYARILGPTHETLTISRDGGETFTPAVSIPGKLNAFLKLASGTLLVAGTDGLEASAYRSHDGARTFEPWPNAPHVHALAERQGKLYIAANNFTDGYFIAVSDDEGRTVRPLAGFEDVQGVKACVAAVCAESCEYQADINLWPPEVCGPVDPDPALTGGPSPDDGATAGGGSAAAQDSRPRSNGASALTPTPTSRGCACSAVGAASERASILLLAALLFATRFRRPQLVAADAFGAAITSSPRN